jgi:hypothetical protein
MASAGAGDHALADEKRAMDPALEKLVIRKPPLGEDVILLRGLCKRFALDGREDAVTALNNVNLHPESVFKPIRRGEVGGLCACARVCVSVRESASVALSCGCG